MVRSCFFGDSSMQFSPKLIGCGSWVFAGEGKSQKYVWGPRNAPNSPNTQNFPGPHKKKKQKKTT